MHELVANTVHHDDVKSMPPDAEERRSHGPVLPHPARLTDGSKRHFECDQCRRRVLDCVPSMRKSSVNGSAWMRCECSICWPGQNDKGEVKARTPDVQASVTLCPFLAVATRHWRHKGCFHSRTDNDPPRTARRTRIHRCISSAGPTSSHIQATDTDPLRSTKEFGGTSSATAGGHPIFQSSA